MMNRAAAAIVHRYPAPWRERYEAEVLSLIEDSPVRFTDLGELVRGLVVERARALIEDADHPQRAIALMSAAPVAFVVLVVASAWGGGLVLRSWREVPLQIAEPGTGLLLAWMAVYEWVRWRNRRRHGATWLTFPRPQIPVREGALLLPLLFVVIVGAEWLGTQTSSSRLLGDELYFWMWTFMRVNIYAHSASGLSAAFWPQHRMLAAFGQLTTAEAELQTAQTWADGCKTWIATGVPALTDDTMAQLREAEARVQRWGGERDAALAQLQSLGYRARFERSA